jgi:hypothetical protein
MPISVVVRSNIHMRGCHAYHWQGELENQESPRTAGHHYHPCGTGLLAEPEPVKSICAPDFASILGVETAALFRSARQASSTTA